MSTQTQRSKHEWIIIMPDQEGALDRRMKVRQDHLAGIQSAEAGFWAFGGAFLEEVPKEGETPKMKGSIMLAVAETKEEVIETLKKDIYSQSDVWDWDKVQIYPFRTAIRTAL